MFVKRWSAARSSGKTELSKTCKRVLYLYFDTRQETGQLDDATPTAIINWHGWHWLMMMMMMIRWRLFQKLKLEHK